MYLNDEQRGQEVKRVVFCRFCHWTKVEPGTNCPKCNTYMPPESRGGRGSWQRSFSLRSVRRRSPARIKTPAPTAPRTSQPARAAGVNEG
jgi:hypothetical protein